MFYATVSRENATILELPAHSLEAVEQELEFSGKADRSGGETVRSDYENAEADLLKSMCRKDLEHGSPVENRPDYLVSRVHSTGGHARMGQICGDINRNLNMLPRRPNLLLHGRRLSSNWEKNCETAVMTSVSQRPATPKSS
jgi:hypothetical protein